MFPRNANFLSLSPSHSHMLHSRAPRYAYVSYFFCLWLMGLPLLFHSSIPAFHRSARTFLLCGRKHKTATQFWRWTVQWRTLTFCILVSLAFFVRFWERASARGTRWEWPEHVACLQAPTFNTSLHSIFICIFIFRYSHKNNSLKLW